jgi:regulator of replication initiation timing
VPRQSFDVGDYIPKALYHSAQKRNSELNAEIKRLEQEALQLIEGSETLRAERDELKRRFDDWIEHHEDCEANRSQALDDRDKLVAALRSALVLAEIHDRPWDERDSAELDRLSRLLDSYS